MLGQNTISSAAMGFEAFLSNNSVFVEENEVLRFIDFTVSEADERYRLDSKLFDLFDTPDSNVLIKKVLNNCKFEISREFYQTLLQIISNLTSYEKILLFYKNNLYEFCDTPVMKEALIKIHTIVDNLLVPDVSQLSDDAKQLVDFIWNMMYAFVIFDHPVYDKVRKNKYTYKKSVAYQDTDSNFLVLGPWVNYIKSIIPDQVPKDKNNLQNFDFKVVNLMTIFVTRVVSCSFACLCNSMNIDDEHSKKLSMKNEFYFTRILFTSKKKRYVARPMLQEGSIIPIGKDREYKGFDFIKSTTKQDIKDFYSDMCYNDILIPEKINIEEILLKIMSFEQNMKELIRNGDRRFFKQSNLKAQKEYENPFSIQGIKAVLLWNTLNPDYAIQLPTDVDIIPIILENGRKKVQAKPGQEIESSVWMVPIGIDSKTGKMKYMNNSGREMVEFAEKHPIQFQALSSEILTNPNTAISAMGLNYIAMPKNTEVPFPDWLRDIIDTEKIVNDALNLFNPIMKSLGIHLVKGSNNTEHFSNIVSI